MISAIQKILELLIVKEQQNSPTVTILLKKIGIWGISQIPKFLYEFRGVYFQDFGNFSNDWIFHRFPCIWGIWQIPRYLRNSPDSKIFPDSLKNLRVFYFSTIGNREISQINREFSKFPSFWGTPQISRHLVNSTNSQVFEEFQSWQFFNCCHSLTVAHIKVKRVPWWIGLVILLARLSL